MLQKGHDDLIIHFDAFMNYLSFIKSSDVSNLKLSSVQVFMCLLSNNIYELRCNNALFWCSLLDNLCLHDMLSKLYYMIFTRRSKKSCL